MRSASPTNSTFRPPSTCTRTLVRFLSSRRCSCSRNLAVKSSPSPGTPPPSHRRAAPRRRRSSGDCSRAYIRGCEGGTEDMGIIAVANLVLLLTYWNVLTLLKPKASP
ncbi:hypothetical protein EJB05_21845, partial [Eragrostis curvula]